MHIALAEDSALLRDGLVHILQRRAHHVDAAVENADALLAAIEHARPDLAIIDVRLPPTFTDEGIRAALQLRQRHPQVAICVLSQHVETRSASALLAGDVSGLGYLLKDRVTDVAEFLETIERIAGGATVLDPHVVTQIIAASLRRDDGLDRLTPRERDVLALMAEGHTNPSIAARLHLSNASIEKNVTTIFSKLGLRESATDHRRVLAVLRYLDGTGGV